MRRGRTARTNLIWKLVAAWHRRLKFPRDTESDQAMFSCRRHPKSSQTRFPDRRSRPARPHRLDRSTSNMGPVLARRKRAQIFGQTRPAASDSGLGIYRRLINPPRFDKAKCRPVHGFNGDRRDQPFRPVPRNFQRSTPQAKMTARQLIGTRIPKIASLTMPANPKTRKARPQRPGFLLSGSRS